MGDFPLMTPNGTFVINGAERVVVSPAGPLAGRVLHAGGGPDHRPRARATAKLIPNRGAWLEFETSNRDVMSVKVDRKRKIPVTTLLRAIDRMTACREAQLGTDERILAKFADVDVEPGPPVHRDDARARRRLDEQDGGAARSSTGGCAPATRRRWRTRASCCSRCSSTAARYDLGTRRPLQAEPAARTRPEPQTIRILTAERPDGDHPDAGDPAEQRRRRRRTTSTTWATAACARSAS